MALSHELNQTKRCKQIKIENRLTTMVRFISHTEQYGDAFAELHRLSVIEISLPVMHSVRYESRAYQHLDMLIKTYGSLTMGEKLNFQRET
jgi:delta 1-pyrroline-5-carboxylate dehydrogenase